MAEEKKAAKHAHNVILENRRTAAISGVKDVDSFDEQTVTLLTDMGVLVIRGQGLHINRLNVENGELSVEGDLDSVTYSDGQGSKGNGFFKKLFR